MQAGGEAGERRLLSAASMVNTRGLLQDNSDPTTCVGINEYSQEECGNRPGYKQALSANAIHQACPPYFFFCTVCFTVCQIPHAAVLAGLITHLSFPNIQHVQCTIVRL